MKDWLEIRFWRMALWLLERGYGHCDTPDYVDFPEHDRALNGNARCAACQATEVQTWIRHHIQLIEN